MVAAGRLLAFAATAAVVIAIPGASVFAVGRALASGRRVAGLSAAVGAGFPVPGRKD